MLYSTPTSYRPLRTAPAPTWSGHLCVQLPASFRLTSFVSTVYLLLPLHGYSSTPFESIRYALLSPRWSVEPPPGAKSGTQPCKNPFCSTCATGPIVIFTFRNKRGRRVVSSSRRPAQPRVYPRRESNDELLARCPIWTARRNRSEEHTSELQSRFEIVCRLLLEKKKQDRDPIRS